MNGESDPIGGQIKRFRQRLGISQEELARKAGCSAASISMYERGAMGARYGDPKLSTIRRLARALGVSASALVAE